jgi:hypothetical protein
MRGISVWMFSKIVMLVFLLVTFSTVIGFMRLTSDKVSTDSAQALAMQLKDAIETTLYTNTISSQAVVPIPKTLPETGGSTDVSKLKSFTVNVDSELTADGKIIYVAIGWGDNPSTYTAASSFMASKDVQLKPTVTGGFKLLSSKHRYFIVKKDATSGIELCFQACTSSYFDSSCTKC